MIWSALPEWIAGQPNWAFYLVGALGVIIVFAFRIAFMTTPRVQFARLTRFVDSNKVEWVRAEIKNKSYTDIQQAVKVSMESLEKWPVYSDDPVLDFPLVLTSQQRLRRAEKSELSQKKLSLSAGDRKSIELFRIDEASIYITHEGGTEKITLGNHLFEYRIIGPSSRITFWIVFVYHRNFYSYFLARDTLSLLALRQLGNRGWWERSGARKIS